MNWNILTTAAGGAFIEFLEIVVIAYAIARSGYPREAVAGSIAGTLIVAAIAFPFSKVLKFIPIHWLEIFVGTTLIWFGGNWIRKSIQRQVEKRRASWMSNSPLEAEGIILDDQNLSFNTLNFLIMTKSSLLESLEIAILIVTLGLASEAWYEALIGMTAALGVAVLIVAVLHRYLLNIPEVLIKLGVGILLSALGTFWLGEGLGIEWKDFTVVVIAGIYSALAALSIWWLSRNDLKDTALKSEPPA
jgi:Ca2+/H+ antiporter, TMEM165/GDT1 family